MLTPTVQLYSNYDKAMADLVHLLKYPPVAGEARPVLHVFATAERAMAQVERKLRMRPDDAQRAIPLAFVAIERIAETFNPRRASRAYFRRMWRTADSSKYFGMDWPIPVDLTYQVTLWAKQIEDINSLVVQWFSLFDHTPRRYVTVEHPFPLSTRIVPVTIAEVTSVPMIAEAERQRLVRKVFTNVVEGWVAREVYEYGRVEKITTRVFDSDDLVAEGDLLGEVVVTGS